jgi:hypothetical protein
VFLVHTHDSACVGRTDCVLWPVADQLRWAGPIGPIPSPTSTQPPSGLSAAQAEAIATEATRADGRAVMVVSSRSGHYAEVGPPGSTDVDADRWVWAVVLETIQVAPSCPSGAPCPVVGSTTLVVVDFVTGEVLIQETPAPTDTQPTDGISKEEAERIAVNEALSAPQRSGNVLVVSSRFGRYAEVGRPGSSDVAGDRWVWAVVVSGRFTTPHCSPPTACLSSVEDSLIVLDYVTGEVLLQETPAPSS